MKTEVIKIDPENIDLEKIKQAAGIIKQGGLVAFPTETVYGLGADSFNQQALDRIFALKRRPKTRPLTVQIADITYLEKMVCDISTFDHLLMSKFWPGPLTLVLKAKGGGTIGIRIPDNKIARSLIKESQRALAVPSANISGKPPAKTAEEVLQTFDGLVEMIIDGGKTELGVVSTVVDLTVSPFKILREGAISLRDIQSAQS